MILPPSDSRVVVEHTRDALRIGIGTEASSRMAEGDDYLRTLLAQAAGEEAYLNGLTRSPDGRAVADRPTETAASVSLMITQRQRQQLRERGVSDEAIRAMTPTEAHRRLALPR